MNKKQQKQEQEAERAQMVKDMLAGWDLSAVTLGSVDDVVICQLSFQKAGHPPQRILATVSAEAAPDFYACLAGQV